MKYRFDITVINNSTGLQQVVSFYNDTISSFDINYNENWFDKIEPDELSVSLANGVDNNGSLYMYYVVDESGEVKVVHSELDVTFKPLLPVKFYSSKDGVSWTQMFVGVLGGTPTFSTDDMKVTFKCEDLITKLKKEKTNAITYVNRTLYYIVDDILRYIQTKTGYGYTILIDGGVTTPTIPVVNFTDEDNLVDVLEELTKSCGGKFYFDHLNERFVFDMGMYYTTYANPDLTFDETNVIDYRITPEKNYEKVSIKFSEVTIENNMKNVVEMNKGSSSAIKVPPSGYPTPTDENDEPHLYFEFNDYGVLKIESYESTLSHCNFSWEVELDRTTYDNNIGSNGYLKNTKKIEIKFNNKTKDWWTPLDGYIYWFVIKGQIYYENDAELHYPEVVSSTQEKILEVNNKIVRTKEHAKQLATYLYNFKNTKMSLTLPLKLFYDKQIKIGSIVATQFINIATHMIVEKIQINESDVVLDLRMSNKYFGVLNIKQRKMVLPDKVYTTEKSFTYFDEISGRKNINVIKKDSIMLENKLGLRGGALTSAGTTYGRMFDPYKEHVALQFDGVDDYVSIPHNSVYNVTQSFTLEAKVYTTVSNQSKVIVGKQGSFGMVLVDGKIKFVIWDNEWISNVTLPTNKWVHITLVYDYVTQKRRIYFDGTLMQETTTSGSVPTSTNPITVGKWYDLGIEEYFNGRVAEVRLWNKALTEQEVKSSVNYGVWGTENGLIGYWKFHEGKGSTGYDYSVNNNEATIFGATWFNDYSSVSTGVSISKYNYVNSSLQIPAYSTKLVAWYMSGINLTQGKYLMILDYEAFTPLTSCLGIYVFLDGSVIVPNMINSFSYTNAYSYAPRGTTYTIYNSQKHKAFIFLQIPKHTTTNIGVVLEFTNSSSSSRNAHYDIHNISLYNLTELGYLPEIIKNNLLGSGIVKFEDLYSDDNIFNVLTSQGYYVNNYKLLKQILPVVEGKQQIFYNGDDVNEIFLYSI